MIDQLISELVAYGLQNGLVDDADKVYVTNGLLELFQRQDYQEPEESGKPRAMRCSWRAISATTPVAWEISSTPSSSAWPKKSS